MKRFIHCILTLTVIAFCFTIPSSLAEGILADGWADHSVEELQTAKEKLDLRIEELKAIQEQKSDSTEETDSTGNVDSTVLLDDSGVVVIWKCFACDGGSLLQFHPDLYIENSSDEVVSVSASDFYVNGYLMSISNANTITLEPETRLRLSTKFVWLLSAEDLIDVYELKTIDKFSMSLTVKLGEKYLVENKKVSVDTDIDIYEMMGENSYFTEKYPQNQE